MIFFHYGRHMPFTGYIRAATAAVALCPSVQTRQEACPSSYRNKNNLF